MKSVSSATLTASTALALLAPRQGARAQNVESFAPRHLLVGVEPTVRPVAETIAELRADPRSRDVRRLFADRIWLVELDAPDIESESADRLRCVAGVRYVELDAVVHIDDVPDDPSYATQWGFPQVSAPQAWTIQRYASSIVVAVIDTGVQYTHPDLAANIWTNTGEIPGNHVDDDHNGYVDDVHGYDFADSSADPFDVHGHGTHVAGTIGAATNNAVGVSGVCWCVQIMPLKFIGWTGYGYNSDAILSLDYARTNGARLTGNSWGGAPYSAALRDAIDLTGDAGMLFVCSAGNNAVNTDFSPHYPSCYDLPEIISVAASTPADDFALYPTWGSNWGAFTVDLAAPGTDVLSTLPFNSYGLYSGTSMACPHVAGAVCLMMAHCPSLTAPQIKTALLHSVDVLPAFYGTTVSGGRLNLAAALIQGCGLATVYCTAGTTTNGCVASIRAIGQPLAGASSGFTLAVTNVEGQRSGILFYGIDGPTALTWATNSTSSLCVKPPTQRLSVQNTGGNLFECGGSLSVDFLAFMATHPTALGQPIAAGHRFNAQAWFRDPPAPKTTNLSNALEFPLVP